MNDSKKPCPHCGWATGCDYSVPHPADAPVAPARLITGDEWITAQVARHLDIQFRRGFHGGWMACERGDEKALACANNGVGLKSEYDDLFPAVPRTKDELTEFLKDDETPIQRLKREIRDSNSLASQLAEANKLLSSLTRSKHGDNTQQTDVSRRLRTYPTCGVAAISCSDLHAAAEEIERYYRGMLGWKEEAEAKDRAAQVWQPIETAPKDQRVLLWFPKFGNEAYTEFGEWEAQLCNKKPRPYWSGDMERALGVNWYREYQPTHWMPIPTPPVIAHSADKESDNG